MYIKRLWRARASKVHKQKWSQCTLLIMQNSIQVIPSLLTQENLITKVPYQSLVTGYFQLYDTARHEDPRGNLWGLIPGKFYHNFIYEHFYFFNCFINIYSPYVRAGDGENLKTYQLFIWKKIDFLIKQSKLWRKHWEEVLKCC